MGSIPVFATDELAAVLAAVAGPEEACGLLLAGADGEVRIVPARNVSARPRDSFEVDPAALIAAHRAARAGGSAVLGCWHTHPVGPPMPSDRDARDAAPDGRLWLIAGRAEDGVGARLWRAVRLGAVRGRFDAVDYAVAPGGVEKAGPAVQGSLRRVGDPAPARGNTA